MEIRRNDILVSREKYLSEENGRINNLEIEATKTDKVETSKGDIKL